MDLSAERRKGCEAIRELIAWYPSGDLDERERCRVEDHVPACTSCAELLRFASGLKTALVSEGAAAEEPSPVSGEQESSLGTGHPDPETLVRFAEGHEALDREERERVRAHLVTCGECAREVSILETVEQELLQAEHQPSGEPGWLGRFWDSLAASLLRPVPAAVYLTVAVCALAILLVRPGQDATRTADVAHRPVPATGGPQIAVLPATATEGTIGGVVLLTDETAHLRGGQEDGAPVATLAGTEAHFLLMEFTDLQSPPRAEDRYQVALVPEGSGQAVWRGGVGGASFRENYTLCLMLGPGTLDPGRYAVTVAGPGDQTVFRSTFEVR